MLGRRIGFGIWCLLVIGCFLFAKTFFTAVFFMSTIGILLFSVVSVLKAKKKLQVSLHLDEKAEQGKKNAGSITLKNTGAFPVFRVQGTVCCKYDNLEKEIPFTCAVKPYMEQRIIIPADREGIGTLTVSVEDIRIFDLIGIFSCALTETVPEKKAEILPKEEKKDAS